jgi:hypothetical protein
MDELLLLILLLLLLLLVSCVTIISEGEPSSDGDLIVASPLENRYIIFSTYDDNQNRHVEDFVEHMRLFFLKVRC